MLDSRSNYYEDYKFEHWNLNRYEKLFEKSYNYMRKNIKNIKIANYKVKVKKDRRKIMKDEEFKIL